MAKNKGIIIYLLCIALVCSAFNEGAVRQKLRATYTQEIGVREATKHNDGKRVEAYLHYCGLPKGYAWCAAFVSWCYGQAGMDKPRNAQASALFPKERIIWKRGEHLKNQPTPQPGDLAGFYYPEHHRIAHVGFVDSFTTKYVYTVEGNTNDNGSREGDGVYRKKRLIRQVYCVGRWML